LPQEIAETVLRTVATPIVTKYFGQLVPEFSCWGGNQELGTFVGFAGITDAVALSENGEAEFVIDWKSDVAPSSMIQQKHAAQVRDYLNIMGIPQGAVIYMSSGKVVEVSREST
jgi:hypothetical protein